MTTSIDLRSERAAPVRQSYVRLSTRVPLVMAPVRIETRVLDGNPERLGIRVYPDQIHLDQHDPALTKRERQLGLDYWVAQRASELGDRATRPLGDARRRPRRPPGRLRGHGLRGRRRRCPPARPGPLRGPSPAAPVPVGGVRLREPGGGVRRRRPTDPRRSRPAHRQRRRPRLAHRLHDRAGAGDGRRGRTDWSRGRVPRRAQRAGCGRHPGRVRRHDDGHRVGEHPPAPRLGGRIGHRRPGTANQRRGRPDGRDRGGRADPRSAACAAGDGALARADRPDRRPDRHRPDRPRSIRAQTHPRRPATRHRARPRRRRGAHRGAPRRRRSRRRNAPHQRGDLAGHARRDAAHPARRRGRPPRLPRHRPRRRPRLLRRHGPGRRAASGAAGPRPALRRAPCAPARRAVVRRRSPWRSAPAAHRARFSMERRRRSRRPHGRRRHPRRRGSRRPAGRAALRPARPLVVRAPPSRRPPRGGRVGGVPHDLGDHPADLGSGDLPHRADDSAAAVGPGIGLLGSGRHPAHRPRRQLRDPAPPPPGGRESPARLRRGHPRSEWPRRHRPPHQHHGLHRDLRRRCSSSSTSTKSGCSRSRRAATRCPPSSPTPTIRRSASGSSTPRRPPGRRTGRSSRRRRRRWSRRRRSTSPRWPTRPAPAAPRGSSTRPGSPIRPWPSRCWPNSPAWQ